MGIFPTYTPLQFEAKYHQLNVTLDGMKSCSVNVRRYQNNDEKYKNKPEAGNKDALVKKDILVGRMIHEARRMTANAAAIAKGKKAPNKTGLTDDDFELRVSGAMSQLSIPQFLISRCPAMMQVHSGKGSIDEIATCLHLIALFGLYDKKKFGDDAASGVRDYCDKYIGLDCNGFVGNYARHIRAGKVPDTQIPSYAPKNLRRTKLESVAPLDVLVWTDFGHIAIIDSIQRIATGKDNKPALDCVVVESSGGNPSGGNDTKNGGLQHSTYSIRSVGKDNIFQVERPKGKGLTNVFIAPLA